MEKKIDHIHFIEYVYRVDPVTMDMILNIKIIDLYKSINNTYCIIHWYA